MQKLFSIVVIFLVGGLADAGPFFHRPILRRPIFPLFNWKHRIATLPCVESREEADLVRLQSSPTSEEESFFLPQPPIALDPVPGTGSKSPTSPKQPVPVPGTLDAETAKKIQELLAASQPKQPVLPIALQADDSTSQRWSRLLTILEWLLWLGGAMGLQSFLGKFGPLVALLGSGLRGLSKPNVPEPSPGPTVNTSSHASGS